MPSFLDKPVPWHKQKPATTPPARPEAAPRRNTHDNSYFPAYDQARGSLSRNNSDSSITSHKSLTARRGSYASGRISPKAIDQPKSDNMSGWKALFGGKDQGSKDKKKKDTEKLVITSRHAAAVKTRLQTDPKFANERRKSSDGSIKSVEFQQPRPSAHITAQEQEMRFPHSGAPALLGSHRAGKDLRSGHKDADMPELTRIQSGDENDEEDERRRKDRENWLSRQQSGKLMKRVIERKESATGEIEEVVEEVPEDSVQETEGGIHFIGADIQSDPKYQPKTYKNKQGLGAGWAKQANGKPGWTRSAHATPVATPTNSS